MGILQFAKIGDKRGDYERRVAKLKEYKHPQDDAIAEMLKSNSMFNSAKQGRKMNSNIGGDDNNHFVPIKDQIARNNPKSNYLPVHMQNLNGRIALSNANYNSLKANNFKERPFLDPISSLNTRKDFHFTTL